MFLNFAKMVIETTKVLKFIMTVPLMPLYPLFTNYFIEFKLTFLNVHLNVYQVLLFIALYYKLPIVINHFQRQSWQTSKNVFPMMEKPVIG